MHHIDSHVHIDFYSNPSEVAKAYELNRIYTLFVTNLPEVYGKFLNVFSSYKYIRLCLGYHPQLASEYELDRRLFKRYVETTKYIGEVGLDFHGESPFAIKRQINNFEYITAPEFNRGRIYTIHSKKAEDEVLRILKSNDVKHAIFHWYTGKFSTMEKILSEGYYFSVNSKMLQSDKGKEIIRRIPIERILFETDGPFVRINKKICTPDMIESIYKEFESIIPNFEEQVFKNFKRILVEKDLKIRITKDKSV